jgi:hypothetical protein
MLDWTSAIRSSAAPIKTFDHVSTALKACLSQASGKLRVMTVVGAVRPTSGSDQKTVKIKSFAEYAARGDLHNPPPDLLSFQVLRSLISLNLL